MIIDNPKIEHFCTLFDSNYLPLGMTLHSSLMTHAEPFHLWIICMDEKVEEDLKFLDLPSVSLIPLREVENPDLLRVKKGRSRREYCWTMTPFTFTAVFARMPDLDRVTYVDADVFFFDDPRVLIAELEDSGRDVLITEHAYDPRYDQTHTSGRFCVQFLTINNNYRGLKVVKWWQEKCLDWCFDRLENGKFGDQKYLDSWPLLFSRQIWIIQQKERTLAPWNIDYFSKILGNSLSPVFYHFHGLKILAINYIIASKYYIISDEGLNLYNIYLKYLSGNFKRLDKLNIKINQQLSINSWEKGILIEYRSPERGYFKLIR